MKDSGGYRLAGKASQANVASLGESLLLGHISGVYMLGKTI